MFKKSSSPSWNEDFNLSNEGILPNDNLRFNVWSHGTSITLRGKDTNLGYVDVSVSDLSKTPITDNWFKLKSLDDGSETDGEIHLLLAYGADELPDSDSPAKGKKKRLSRGFKGSSSDMTKEKDDGDGDKKGKKKDKKKK